MSFLMTAAVVQRNVDQLDARFTLACICGAIAIARFLIGLLCCALRALMPPRRPSHAATLVWAGVTAAAGGVAATQSLFPVLVALYVWLASSGALLAAAIVLWRHDAAGADGALRGFEVLTDHRDGYTPLTWHAVRTLPER